MKKLSKCLLLAFLTTPLIFSACASNSNSTKTNAKVSNPHVKISIKAEIPDTSSTIVTQPQDMNLELTAIEFSRIMGNGINLGNTMESYRSGSASYSTDATTYEKLWGQPITSENMIKGYKAAGFDTIRIPVAWTNVVDYENGNYVISKTYLDRIETLVNYALDAGLYVIINDHWDGGWWGMFGSRTEEIRDCAMELYKALWTQIGIRFQNYSYKLIFEGGNEEIGDRLNDNNVCWDSGYLKDDGAKYEAANKINQAFVDTIRSQGGNNASRFLLIPGYNTDVKKTCDNRYKMPKDTIEGRLFVSVHYYDPSPLCIGDGDEWGSKQDIKEMGDTLKMMSKFVEKGYGVIIGEYGVLPSNGKYKSATMIYHSTFLDYCDSYSFCPVLWDTGNACFYNKSECKLNKDEFAQLYKAHSWDIEKEYSVEKVKSAAQERLKKTYSEAPDSLSGSDLEGRKDIAIAYIMYADQAWSTNYSVGDQYKPGSKSKGIEARDIGITEPGTYTVALDFSNMNGKGTSKAIGFSFCALGIANGEDLHPDWVIDIKSISVNGKEVKMTKKNYTSSDDGHCTRSNIVNDWVSGTPKGRTIDGNLDDCGATIIDKTAMIFQAMKTFEITFYYGPAN